MTVQELIEVQENGLKNSYVALHYMMFDSVNHNKQFNIEYIKAIKRDISAIEQTIQILKGLE